MTIEELQAEQLRLQDEIKTRDLTIAKLNTDVTTLTTSNESLRTHNQQLFLRVTEKKPTPPIIEQDKSLEELVKEYIT